MLTHGTRNIVLLSALFIALYTGYYWLTLMPARRALPWSASDIQEDHRTFGMIPDFSYSLTAKIDPQDFPAFVEKLGLTRTYNSQKHPDVNLTWGNCAASWWQPPTLEGAAMRYEPENEYLAVAKMSGDRVYFFSMVW
jgi:hypothetical protein